jgi:hypothetical protein
MYCRVSGKLNPVSDRNQISKKPNNMKVDIDFAPNDLSRTATLLLAAVLRIWELFLPLGSRSLFTPWIRELFYSLDPGAFYPLDTG